MAEADAAIRALCTGRIPGQCEQVRHGANRVLERGRRVETRRWVTTAKNSCTHGVTIAAVKTTIDLPDGLAIRAKELAAAQGVTLRELVEAGLRTELDRRSIAARPADFRFRTVGGSGLREGIELANLREHAYNAARAER